MWGCTDDRGVLTGGVGCQGSSACSQLAGRGRPSGFLREQMVVVGGATDWLRSARRWMRRAAACRDPCLTTAARRH